MDARSHLVLVARGSLVALALGGALGCASGADVPREALAPVRAPAPDFVLLDAEIDAMLWGDDLANDPDAYSPVGKRDPFRGPQEVVAPTEGAGAEVPLNRSCPAALLQGTQVDELRLEGLVRLSNGGAARATFAGVDGRGAIAGVGDELTDDCAVVRAIGAEGVTVAVVHRSQRGELVERARVIPLHAAPAEP